ncbi:hypothetical protein [Zobellella sp. DQSA1]|uniref:glycine zipper domain-containing protein n=1 Tax=Zobellella sp. DQSA1 TaxID=3342386 RepID=UPI0035C008CF
MATAQNNQQELQEQLDALRKDFAELTSILKGMTANYAKEGQENVKATAEQAQQHLKQSLCKAQQEVESHPYTSMAVAFGVGLLLGKLLDR